MKTTWKGIDSTSPRALAANSSSGRLPIRAKPTPPPNVDFSAHRIGIGARFPISGGRSPIELWGALNYERVVVEGSVGYGPGIDIGLRSQLTPQFDLDLAVKIFGDIDFDDFDADYTGYELTGAYKLRPDLSLLVSYGSYEVDLDGGPSIDLDGMISVGLRLHF